MAKDPLAPDKLFIIILNWNGKRDTLACLESLKAVENALENTVIVDNGSTDDSIATIRSAFPKICILEAKDNLGFAEGNNIGIRHARAQGADSVLLLNNDTLVDPKFLEAFKQALRTHPEAGIFGAKVYLHAKPDTLDHIGGKWNRDKGVFDLLGNRESDTEGKWEKIHSIEYACGCALLIRKEVFEQIGLLEPRFFLIWEEADFCFRAKRAGFPTLFCPEAKVWHKVSASFVGGKPHTTYFWWRNRFLWIERNCAPKERWRLFLLVLAPELLHIAKLYLLKTIQLFFEEGVAKHTEEKQRRQLQYRAALRGAKDYFFRRFGPGPSWIHSK